MENKNNYSNELNTVSEELVRAYERLGAKLGHAVAIKVENGYKIGYCNQIISPKVFKDLKSVRAYMKENPYEFLPLMAYLYNERLTEIKKQQK